MAERVEKNPYKQFRPGQSLSFTLQTLNPDDSDCLSDKQVVISAVKGGGFFGRVLMLECRDDVIKTSVPDAWHDLWRRVNWGFRDFPSQVDETQAKLDYLATNLIADTLPILTDGKFQAPHSFGYALLPNGYSHDLEKMHGRPPRYDTDDDEFSQFKQAQEELTALALEMGLEHGAQVYRTDKSTNPFGLANLWRDPEKNCWIWLDTLPAIPHKGFIWPLYHFRFHKNVRDWFYPAEDGQQEITFNRIHTDKFLDFIGKQRYKFSDEEYQRVLGNVEVYEKLWQERNSQQPSSRNFAGAIRAVTEVVTDQIPKPLALIKSAVTTPLKTILNPEWLALDGVEEAFQAGVINQEELDKAKTSVSSDLSAARMMAIFHEAYGWFLAKPGSLLLYASILGVEPEKIKELNILELISYTVNQAQDMDKAIAIGTASVGFMAYGGLARRTATKLIGHHYGTDTTRARYFSLIPFIGDHLSIASQVAASSGNSGEEIWHYSVRNIVAKMSSLPFFPDGGWGTEREGRWWHRWGKHLESLGRKIS